MSLLARHPGCYTPGLADVCHNDITNDVLCYILSTGGADKSAYEARHVRAQAAFSHLSVHGCFHSHLDYMVAQKTSLKLDSCH